MCSARRSARRSGSPRAIRSRSCRRPPCSSASIACNGCVARPAAPRRAPSCRPTCRGEPSARASRQRSPASRSETASRAVTRSSSSLSSSERASARALSRRSCSARPRRPASPTRTCSARSAPPRPSTSRRPAGAPPGSDARFRGVLTGQEALFRSAEGRHRREAQALLGEDFSGSACADRWWAFRLPRPAATPALLGAPGARLHRPQRGTRRPEGVRRGRP